MIGMETVWFFVYALPMIVVYSMLGFQLLVGHLYAMRNENAQVFIDYAELFTAMLVALIPIANIVLLVMVTLGVLGGIGDGS